VARLDHTFASMSTSSTAAPSHETGEGPARDRILSRPLLLVFLSEFCVLTSFYLLLSVTPKYVAARAGSTGAGLVTGMLLLGTVAAELAAPLLMKRYGYRTVLAAGALLLGAPALALLPAGPLVITVTVSVVRGLGFGLCGVVAGAFTAVLLPPDRRGEGLGLSGVVDGVPGVIALPAGLWLADHYGYAVVIGLAAAVALLPLAVVPWLPGGADRRATDAPAEAGQPAGLLAGLRQGRLLRPAVIFAASTVAGGVIVSFLPIAAGVSGNLAAVGLLAQALTATISPWWAGRHGDRHGHARLLAPGLAIASLGMGAMIWLSSPAAVIAGMCLFGIGFGIIQNATLALMIDRVPPSGVGTASALWSLAYDAGYGAGPAAFGLLVIHTGYAAGFALTGALMLAALPVAWRERSADSRLTVDLVVQPDDAVGGDLRVQQAQPGRGLAGPEGDAVEGGRRSQAAGQ
jgi:MFS family permease